MRYVYAVRLKIDCVFNFFILFRKKMITICPILQTVQTRMLVVVSFFSVLLHDRAVGKNCFVQLIWCVNGKYEKSPVKRL